MRFSVATILSVSTLLLACGAAPNHDPNASSASEIATASLVVDDQDNGKTFSVTPGETIEVRLASHGDAGYQWVFVDGEGLPAPRETREPGSGRPGDFGYEIFTFDTLGGSGIHNLQFADRRAWEHGPGIPFSVVVELGETEPDAGQNCSNIPECPPPPMGCWYGPPVCIDGVNECGPVTCEEDGGPGDAGWTDGGYPEDGGEFVDGGVVHPR
jgi:predicted secreted protein